MDLFGVLIFGFIMIFGVVGKVEAVTSLIPAQDCSVGAVCDWSDADNAVRICKDGYIDRNWSMYSGHTCNGQKRVIDASGVDVSYMYGPNLNAPTAYGDNSGYSCSSGGLTWVRPSNASLGAPMAYVVMVNDRSINADYVPTSTASNYDPKDKWIVVTDHQVALGYAALNLTPGVSYDIGVWPYYLNEPYGKWSRHSIYRIGPQIMCTSPTSPSPTRIPVRCVSSSISSGSLDMSNLGNTVTVIATMANATGNWNSLAMYNIGNTDAGGNAKPAIITGGNVHIGATAGQPSYQDNAAVSTSGPNKTFTWAVRAGDISGIDAATGKVVNDLQFNTYAGGWPIENMESCVQKLHLSRAGDSTYSCPGTPVACACAGPGCKNDGGLGTDWRCCHRTCVNNSCRTVTGSGANSCATDGVSCSSTLLGDYNNDAKVDISDFMIWKDRYNLGQMTFGDFLVWKTAYLAPETISSTIAPP
jgi:hypothetical protein